MSGQGHIVGALGLVLDAEGRVLLVRTARAGWELPGGRVEQGEDLLRALEREVLEEAGCRVAVERLTGVYSSLGEPDALMLVFRCRHLAGDAVSGDDSLEARWFRWEEATAAVTYAAERVRLEDALADVPGVVYRAYRPMDAPATLGAFEERITCRW